MQPINYLAARKNKVFFACVPLVL